MWISKEKYQALVDRIERLENRSTMPTIWYDDWPGKNDRDNFYSGGQWYGLYQQAPMPPSISVTEAVKLILSHLGLRLVKTEKIASRTELRKAKK